ncbi:hypothetical protein [uncultured Shewanella sp.]|uniref:hypothetical protein n=1 Tax=uncultured Shewanella sp. TaxID=173975 RepID=UPI0026055D70|nr:hypothetical protein [uncultured Shewanella sp.]
MKIFKKNPFRIYFTIVIAVFIWGLLLWQHSNGGVPSHHLLHRSDLPAISNWWGGILLPVLSWLLIGMTHKREEGSYPLSVKLGFIGGLLYGIVLSVSFVNGLEQVASLMAPSLLVIALFLPIYHSEYYLGFVIGMSTTFGVVLPIGFALVVVILAYIIYKFIRPIPSYLVEKFRGA